MEGLALSDEVVDFSHTAKGDVLSRFLRYASELVLADSKVPLVFED